jgi:hypothetical protein
VPDVCSFTCNTLAGTSDKFLSWCPRFDEDVPRMLATLLKAPRSDEHNIVCDRLLRDFKAASEMFRHADQEALPTEPKKKYGAKPVCSEVCMCICGVRGDAMWKYHRWLLAMFKRIWVNRCVHLVDNGFIAVRLCAVGEQCDGACPVVPSESDKFHHVSLLYRKPFRPTYRVLDVARVLTGGNVLCHATHTYLTSMEHCAYCVDHFKNGWAIKMYEVLFFDVPIVYAVNYMTSHISKHVVVLIGVVQCFVFVLYACVVMHVAKGRCASTGVEYVLGRAPCWWTSKRFHAYCRLGHGPDMQTHVVNHCGHCFVCIAVSNNIWSL